MFDDSFMKSPRSRFRAAMVLAIVADAAQMVTEKGANCDFGRSPTKLLEASHGNNRLSFDFDG